MYMVNQFNIPSCCSMHQCREKYKKEVYVYHNPLETVYAHTYLNSFDLQHFLVVQLLSIFVHYY